jgi:hypothetical protein
LISPHSEARFQVNIDVKKPEKGNITSGSLSILTDHPKISEIALKCLIRFEDGQ